MNIEEARKMLQELKEQTYEKFHFEKNMIGRVYIDRAIEIAFDIGREQKNDVPKQKGNHNEAYNKKLEESW